LGGWATAVPEASGRAEWTTCGSSVYEASNVFASGECCGYGIF
jgi:hypothetical protein